jgi:hypothetical protein
VIFSRFLVFAGRSSKGIRCHLLYIGLIKGAPPVLDPNILQHVPPKNNHKKDESQIDPSDLNISANVLELCVYD